MYVYSSLFIGCMTDDGRLSVRKKLVVATTAFSPKKTRGRVLKEVIATKEAEAREAAKANIVAQEQSRIQTRRRAAVVERLSREAEDAAATRVKESVLSQQRKRKRMPELR